MKKERERARVSLQASGWVFVAGFPAKRRGLPRHPRPLPTTGRPARACWRTRGARPCPVCMLPALDPRGDCSPWCPPRLDLHRARRMTRPADLAPWRGAGEPGPRPARCSRALADARSLPGEPASIRSAGPVPRFRKKSGALNNGKSRAAFAVCAGWKRAGNDRAVALVRLIRADWRSAARITDRRTRVFMAGGEAVKQRTARPFPWRPVYRPARLASISTAPGG